MVHDLCICFIIGTIQCLERYSSVSNVWTYAVILYLELQLLYVWNYRVLFGITVVFETIQKCFELNSSAWNYTAVLGTIQ